MSTAESFTTSDFDRICPELRARLRDWEERECTSFDEAVRAGSPPSGNEEGLSIWDEMPKIDSKLAVSALVEIEQVTKLRLPVAIIRPGGYDTFEDLVEDLFPKVRARCYDSGSPTMVTPTAVKSARSRSTHQVAV